MSLVCEPNRLPDSASTRCTVNLIAGQEIPTEVLQRSRELAAAGPFGHVQWWDSWWRHLRPRGSELFLMTVSRGDELVGLAPWYMQRTFGSGRVVRFLGDGR